MQHSEKPCLSSYLSSPSSLSIPTSPSLSLNPAALYWWRQSACGWPVYSGVCKYYVSIRGWKPASSKREWETGQKWEWERQREINRIRPHSLTGSVTEEQLWLCTWLCIRLSARHNIANTPPFSGSAHCTTGLRQNFLAHSFVYIWHLLWFWAESGPGWTSEYSCVCWVFWGKIN